MLDASSTNHCLLYDIPVAFPAALLLYLLRIGIDMTGLGKIAREMLFSGGSAVSKADVVAVVLLVGTSHLMVSISINKPAQ